MSTYCIRGIVWEKKEGGRFLGALERKRETDTCTDSDGAWWTAVSARTTSSSDEGLGAPRHPRGSAWEHFLEEGECELTFQTGRVEVGAREGGGCWAVAAGGAEWQWV